MIPRLAAMATLCREAAIPALVLVWIAAPGSAGSNDPSATPTVDAPAQSFAADTKFADRQLTSLGPADVVTVGTPEMEAAAADVTSAVHEPAPFVVAALTDSSEMPPPEKPSEQDAKTILATRESGDPNPPVVSPEALVDCSAADSCVDRYLWDLYQRAPKEDAIRTEEKRKVTVKKRGKLITVTKTFTSVADEDFSWKDPKAAEKAGMPVMDYVIGGMDRDFKLKLFHLFQQAEKEGLSPGITSAFRDDYRQSIASGLKAANDRSYHGGSSHGGYGHGLAADIVSVNGETRAQRLASTQTFWKWIDVRGKDFGIGRPYLDRDPPHVAPMDGKEYADHRSGTKPRQARGRRGRSVA